MENYFYNYANFYVNIANELSVTLQLEIFCRIIDNLEIKVKEMKTHQMTTAVCIASAMAGILAMTGCGSKTQTQPQQAPQIAVETLKLTDANRESTFPATIKGQTDIDIRPQVTGFITKVHVDEGQHVRKGQLLFTLDQVQFQAAVDQTKAAVEAARTQVSTAQLTAANKKELLDKNIISQYEWQVADNSLQSARSALAQAEASLVNARKNLAYTQVTAPSDGVVGVIPNREGSLASPSSAQPLTTVSDNSKVYAYFSLTEKDLLKLTEEGSRPMSEAIANMPAVRLRLADGSIYPYEGKVATVSGMIDAGTGAASVRALFDNPSGMLRSGSTGNIILPVRQTDAIVIPQKATYEIQGRRFVYLVTDSSTVVSAPIEVMSISDGKTFVVTSGLQPGQRIATEGVGTVLRDGVRISPVEAVSESIEAVAADSTAVVE